MLRIQDIVKQLLLFSRSVVSDSLWPHGQQCTRPPCPSPSPRVCSNSCPPVLWVMMPSYHLVLCCPLLLLPSIFPSIRVLSNESALHIRWPKFWSFSFNISPSNEHPGLISFRMDWSDLLAVQGTLRSLLQHHNSKASILQCSAFFIVQLSHPHMTTGKTITLTRRTFVEKVICLLFNMLSRELRWFKWQVDFTVIVQWPLEDSRVSGVWVLWSQCFLLFCLRRFFLPSIL